MKTYSPSERFQAIEDLKAIAVMGFKGAQVDRAIGISRNCFANSVNDVSTPRGQNMHKIAEFLELPQEEQIRRIQAAPKRVSTSPVAEAASPSELELLTERIKVLEGFKEFLLTENGKFAHHIAQLYQILIDAKLINQDAVKFKLVA